MFVDSFGDTNVDAFVRLAGRTLADIDAGDII